MNETKMLEDIKCLKERVRNLEEEMKIRVAEDYDLHTNLTKAYFRFHARMDSIENKLGMG